MVAGGLVDTLSGPGPFTVFAPLNEAFEKLGNETLQKLLDPKNKDELVKILTYHAVSGRVHAEDITDQEENATVEGDKVTAYVHHDDIFINQARVVKADEDATNGVAHAVDGVLIPNKCRVVASLRSVSPKVAIIILVLAPQMAPIAALRRALRVIT